MVSPDGSTLYVAGQGPPDFGGRVVPVTTATGAVGTATSFDAFGITDPAALAVTPDGSGLLVADSANNWVDTVPTADPSQPLEPVRLPAGTGSSSSTGTDHPTDIVTGPDGVDAFVVTGLDTVLPYDLARRDLRTSRPGVPGGDVDDGGHSGMTRVCTTSWARDRVVRSVASRRRTPPVGIRSRGRQGCGGAAPAATTASAAWRDRNSADGRPAAPSSSSRATGMSAARCQTFGIVSGQEISPQNSVPR